jgi:hypothetical protein
MPFDADEYDQPAEAAQAERQRLKDRDRHRQDVVHAYQMAATDVSLVGMSLGWWAGSGDYAKFTEASRDEAGARALDELDAAITELAVARDHLAAELATEAADED